MQTNFFRQIAKMNLQGDLQLTLRATSENNFVLSVLLNNEQCGDEAKKRIPPLNLRGTAEELDNGFFENISEPLQTASGLMVDMDQNGLPINAHPLTEREAQALAKSLLVSEKKNT